jgi:hypothetical protein
MIECVHQRHQVVRERADVVALSGLVGEPDSALVNRDHLEVSSERGHDEAPRVPGLRPAVNEKQWRALASDHRVEAQLPGVDESTRERVCEALRKIWRPVDGSGTLGDGCVAHDGLLANAMS